MRNENEGTLKYTWMCKAAWELLTDNILKTNQCALDGGSIVSKILEIERESKVQFEHMHVKTSKEFEEVNNSKVNLMKSEKKKGSNAKRSKRTRE